MSEKINVQCYKCKTVYELEPEMQGELVECAVCDTVFTVPKLSEKFQTKIMKTHPYMKGGDTELSDKNEQTSVQTSININSSTQDTSTTKLSTDTIKLTKTSRGMIPQIDDKFGICKSHNIRHHDKEKELKDTLGSISAKEAKEAPKKESKPVSKWWKWGKKK